MICKIIKMRSRQAHFLWVKFDNEFDKFDFYINGASHLLAISKRSQCFQFISCHESRTNGQT